MVNNEMIELRNSGLTYRAIGEIFGVSKQRVYQLVNDYIICGTRNKSYMNVKNGGACFSCNSTENLNVHHLNGNKRQNNKHNLILLCAQCHKNIHKK